MFGIPVFTCSCKQVGIVIHQTLLTLDETGAHGLA